MFIVYPSVDAVMIATFPSSGLAIFEDIFFNCIPNEEMIGILNLWTQCMKKRFTSIYNL